MSEPSDSPDPEDLSLRSLFDSPEPTRDEIIRRVSAEAERFGPVTPDVRSNLNDYIFPNEAAVTRLVGAILLEQNDEWQLQHRYMTLDTMAGRSDEPSTALLKAA